MQNHTLIRSTTQNQFSSAATSNATTDAPQTPQKDPNATLILSETCVKKLSEICEGDEKSYLRITVDGGGCSGFQYKFELDSKVNEDDVALGPGKNVLIDTVSLEYCAGATLDYQMELIKSGFRIIGNPKAEQGCSCGASFALKVE